MLAELTEEEKLLAADGRLERGNYFKGAGPKIEQRLISEHSMGTDGAPVCLRAHTRFVSFPEHTHDYIELMYVVKGCITHRIDGHDISLGAGSVIILGKNASHSVNRAGLDDIGVNIIMSAPFFESVVNRLITADGIHGQIFMRLIDGNAADYAVFATAGNSAVENLMENILDSFVEGKFAKDYILRESLALLICYLADAAEEEASPPSPHDEYERRKNSVREYINSSYRTASLSELSSQLGLNSAYLSRWIATSFGMGFAALVNERRFEAAKTMLRLGDETVGEIISAVGYENGSYFFREFRHRYKMSPLKYRSEHGTRRQG